VGSAGEIDGRQERLALRRAKHPVEIEAGAERPAFAGEDDGANFGAVAKFGADLRDRLEHGGIERIQLVRAGEADIGDTVVDNDTNAIWHGVFPCWVA
jgi:hypothetical protein